MKQTLLTRGEESPDTRIELIECTLGTLVDLLREYQSAVGTNRKQNAADDHEIVPLRRAEEISGYSSRQLSRLIKQRVIPNFGSKFRPKMAVGDLPRKPCMARSR
jgi:hypothetical protein